MLLNCPSSETTPSITNKGVPILRICKAVVDPGEPPCWREFKPAILPTKAPLAVTAADRSISVDFTEDTAPVNVAFF